MKIPSAKEVSRRWLQGVLTAFLEGKKDRNWVVGCFKGENASETEFDSILSEALNLTQGHPQRRIEIFQIRERLYR